MKARTSVLLWVLAAVLLGPSAPAALAKPVTIAEAGSGAGQVHKPTSVGINRASGDLYVADDYNYRVDEFAPSGEFVRAWGFGVVNGAEELQVCTSTGCRSGIPGSGGQIGSFSEMSGLVVDQSSGDVWVSDQERVQEFGPSGEALREIPGSDFSSRKNALAIDGAGDLWVGEQEHVQEFGPAGEHIAYVSLPGLGQVWSLAVTPLGSDIYVLGTGTPGVREFETVSGIQVGSTIDETGEPQVIALDGTGNLYVGGECGDHFEENYVEPCYTPYSFKKYTPAGVQGEQFGMGQVIGGPGQFAFGQPNGPDGIVLESGGASPSLYSASDSNSVGAVQRFPLPGPGPLPENESSAAVQPTSTTIQATLDPEGHPTTYRFEYGTQPGVYSQSTATETLSGSAFAAETVQANVSGLLPETAYYYRLSATNHCNEANPSQECTVTGGGASFTTPPAVEIESESALDVTSNSASLEGVLNPQGVAARWWVEYGTQEGTFDHSTAKESLAGGPQGVGVDVHVQGFEQSTVYHYRFVASDVREGHAYTVYGQVLSFTTQPAAASLSLLDGRAWEMVTPLDKQGASFLGDTKEGAINQAAADGAGITYVATASTEASPPGEPAPEDVQVLSEHGVGGWSSRDIASPHEHEHVIAVGKFAEFFAFMPDLSVGLVEPKSTLLGGATEPTPYLRRQALCENQATAGECYLPLVTGQDVTSGERWGGGPEEAPKVRYEAATPDLNHVVLYSAVPLTAEAKGSKSGLYEWSAGKLELVSVLPGEPETPVCGVVNESRLRHVISADGDRVAWERERCDEDRGHLYMHEAAAHRTVQVDVVQSGGSGANSPLAGFQDASGDGSRVFFSDQQLLTADSHAANGAPDLYVYEANADSDPEMGVVRDLTVTANPSEPANVLETIPGAAQDGSVVYVAATGVLSEATNEHGETAQSGQPNLYRVERGEASGKITWTARFIATLSLEDSHDWGGASGGLRGLTGRVSADGRWFAFMSERPLTGYDNRDAVSGQRDEEVFLYDGVSRRLVCVSCDPSGARPHGAASTGENSLLDAQNLWNGRWLAGALPEYESSSLGTGAYNPRSLSASGRLFFDGVDGLAPEDVNSTSDVYEYEPVGVGSCTSASAGYSAAQDGCVGLVSSGISSEESAFLDASESGNDVFFLTAGKLVAGDTDNAYDIYDAHVCGSGWECPVPSAVSPPCTNTASCRGAAEPQPAVFGASGSATFSGAGNLTPGQAVSVKAKARPSTRPQKLARALKACERRPKRKRAGCVRRARRLYGRAHNAKPSRKGSK